MAAADVRQRYEACGQGHVFQYWEELAAADRETLVAQAAEVPIEQVTSVFAESIHGFEAALSAPPESQAVAPLDPTLIASSPLEADLQAWRREGLRLIAAGQTGAIVLAGGQGTRLGSPLPKGMLDLGLPSGRTIFELMAQRILKVQQLAQEECGEGGKVQWYIMTSDATHDVIVEYFRGKDFLGLEQDDVHFFKQGFLPAFSPVGKVLLQGKGS
eukprot:EG_transcript_30045